MLHSFCRYHDCETAAAVHSFVSANFPRLSFVFFVAVCFDANLKNVSEASAPAVEILTRGVSSKLCTLKKTSKITKSAFDCFYYFVHDIFCHPKHCHSSAKHWLFHSFRWGLVHWSFMTFTPGTTGRGHRLDETLRKQEGDQRRGKGRSRAKMARVGGKKYRRLVAPLGGGRRQGIKMWGKEV